MAGFCQERGTARLAEESIYLIGSALFTRDGRNATVVD